MSDNTEDAERAIRIKHMQTEIELYKAQLRWEPAKAIAGIIAAGAVFMGGVVAVSSLWRPQPAPPAVVAPAAPPQTIILQLAPGLSIVPTPSK
jgi:hypothetical protein